MVRGLRASYSVEAAWIMSIVLFSLAAAIQSAYRLHDQAVGSMVLHEMVEAARHEKELEAGRAADLGTEALDGLFTMKGCRVSLSEAGGKMKGTTESGAWEKTIEAGVFRPETFLRQITLLEGLGAENGDSL